MNIHHTSDWRLGKKLDGISRHAEQVLVLDEIIRIADARQAHAVVISGDLFDTFNPPVESVDLFYKTLKRLSANGKRAVIAIAGNHDSPDRIEAPNPLARECGILFLGFPDHAIQPFSLETGLAVQKSEPGFVELKIPDCEYPLRVLVMPYSSDFFLKQNFSEKDFPKSISQLLAKTWGDLAQKYCDHTGINLLAGHLYMAHRGEELPAETDDEKSIMPIGGAEALFTDCIPCQIQYTALGHLHRTIPLIQESNHAVIYSGSPLQYSFNDPQSVKSVMLLRAQPNQIQVEKIPLTEGKHLVKKCFESVESAIVWLQANSDCWVELTIQTQTFLSAEDQKRLYDSHSGIVHIIPDIQLIDAEANLTERRIDLSKDITTLFTDYFQVKHGVKPNEELLEIFNQVLKS